jgi:hypothetical protein
MKKSAIYPRRQLSVFITVFTSIILLSISTTAETIETNTWDRLDEPGWSITTGGSGERPTIDSTTDTPDPANALRFLYPQGCPFNPPSSCGPGKMTYYLPSDLEEFYYGHWFKFQENFQMHPVRTKLNYVFNNYGANGFTGNWIVGVSSSWKITFTNQIIWGIGTKDYHSNTGYDPTVQRNRWYWIEVYAKMNTPGQEDGVIKVWLDDQLVMHHANIPYRSADEADVYFGRFQHNPIWGGVSDQQVLNDQYLWMDYTVISTTPIGMPGSPPAQCSGCGDSASCSGSQTCDDQGACIYLQRNEGDCDCNANCATGFCYEAGTTDYCCNPGEFWDNGCKMTTSSQPAPELPPAEAWVDQGVVLTGGPPGAWDSHVRDGFGVGSVVKKDGTYFLYYEGSSGFRADGGPADRAIGVATSTDGINFVKYSGNPIITHQPSEGHVNQEEEGASQARVIIDNTGKFIMFWGAKTAVGPDTVKIDVHVSESTDGYHFTDKGIVIPHTVDPGEDEVWPLGVLNIYGGTSSLKGNWHIWYETDGYGGRKVSLATGDSPTSLTPQPGNPVIDFESLTFAAWPILHYGGKVSIFEGSGSSFDTASLKVRETNINSLDSYSSPVMTFPSDFPKGGVYLYDFEEGIWRMYHLKREDFTDDTAHIRLKTAPMITCGDTNCDTGECTSCPPDCTLAKCCGIEGCNSAVGETCSTCSDDCGTCPSGEQHWLEAEYTDSITSPMQTDTDPQASESQYIYVPNEAGSGGEATYTITITQPGEYVLWGRTIAPTAADNSFRIDVDGAERIWLVEWSSDWIWDQVNDWDSGLDDFIADPRTFTLSPGIHTIRVRQREDGTKLDKLLLTNDQTYTPSGLGEKAENLPSFCGDQTCDPGEDCSNCPQDCLCTLPIFQDSLPPDSYILPGDPMEVSTENPHLGTQSLKITGPGAWDNCRIKNLGIDVSDIDWNNAYLEFAINSPVPLDYVSINLWGDGVKAPEQSFSLSGSGQYETVKISLTNFAPTQTDFGNSLTDFMVGSNWGNEIAYLDEIKIMSPKSYHRADINNNYCIDLNELLSFIKRWKISSQDVPMPELMEAIGLWKSGTGCS